MDTDTIQLEHELVRNERIIEHSKYGKVRLHRPTPNDMLKIAEQRRRSYHADLKNPDILAKRQVEKFLEERGVWTREDTDRMQELTIMSGDLMVRMAALGYDPTEDVYVQFAKTQLALAEAITDPEAVKALERLFDVDNAISAQDISLLRSHSVNTTTDELIQRAENLRLQLMLLREFYRVKTEWNDLAEVFTQFFGDTIESRAETVERFAMLYYCAKTDDGKPLWPTFTEMWLDDSNDIAWLSGQLFQFQNGITDEYAEVLKTHGFMARGIDTAKSFVNSPDLPESNSDGEPVESTSTDSLVAETPTT